MESDSASRLLVLAVLGVVVVVVVYKIFFHILFLFVLRSLSLVGVLLFALRGFPRCLASGTQIKLFIRMSASAK